MFSSTLEEFDALLFFFSCYTTQLLQDTLQPPPGRNTVLQPGTGKTIKNVDFYENSGNKNVIFKEVINIKSFENQNPI